MAGLFTSILISYLVFVLSKDSLNETAQNADNSSTHGQSSDIKASSCEISTSRSTSVLQHSFSPFHAMIGDRSASTNKAGKDSNEARLRIIPNNRTLQNFTYDEEGQWTGPFWFMQAADTQLGMIDSYVNKNPTPGWKAELEFIETMIQIANNSKPKPKFIVVCGDLVDARPNSLKAAQIQDFKKAFQEVDPEISLICVCGNHDIGDKPSPADIEEYKKEFGDDFFSFWLGGVKFIVLNSQYYIDHSLVTNHRLEQDRWLDSELKPNPQRSWKHLIGFQHVPPFVSSPEELGVFIPNSTVLPFNFANMDERRLFLAKLKLANMSHLFCGHYHRNAGGVDGGLEVVVTTAVGCQLGTDRHGFRAVIVTSRGVKHHFYPFDQPPNVIDVSEK